QKMSAVFPRRLVLAAEPKPGLMHERSRLQSLAWRFPGHFRCGEFAQFFVNEREQFVRSAGVTLLNAIQNSRNVAHVGALVGRFGSWLSGRNAWLLFCFRFRLLS